MSRPILLSIDADLSPITQYALQAVGELLEQAVPQVSVVLLHVIPLTHVIAANPGMYAGQIIPIEVTTSQRNQAEEVIHKARFLLQQRGIAPERINSMIRVGIPADEIIKAANEVQASLIAIGSHGNSLRVRVRRLFLGSVSRRILQLTSCPVMIVVPPRSLSERPRKPPADLVLWYETAITRYLSEHTEALQVFTPQQVAFQFIPSAKRAPSRKEIAAATLALENLAHNGVLFRHDVKGELRYVND